MQILSQSASDAPDLISNAEVLELLSERIQTREDQLQNQPQHRRKPSMKFRHRDWIETHVQTYLQTTPCVRTGTRREELKTILVQSARKRQAEEDEESAQAGFGLTDAEAMQIMNFMPQEPVEIHLMIEELNSRLSEPRQEELIQFIRSHVEEPSLEEENDTSEQEQQEEVVEEEMEVVMEDALEQEPEEEQEASEISASAEAVEDADSELEEQNVVKEEAP